MTRVRIGYDKLCNRSLGCSGVEAIYLASVLIDAHVYSSVKTIRIYARQSAATLSYLLVWLPCLRIVIHYTLLLWADVKG